MVSKEKGLIKSSARESSMVREFVMQEQNQQQQKVRGREKGRSITSPNHCRNSIGLSGSPRPSGRCTGAPLSISQRLSARLGAPPVQVLPSVVPEQQKSFTVVFKAICAELECAGLEFCYYKAIGSFSYFMLKCLLFHCWDRGVSSGEASDVALVCSEWWAGFSVSSSWARTFWGGCV